MQTAEDEEQGGEGRRRTDDAMFCSHTNRRIVASAFGNDTHAMRVKAVTPCAFTRHAGFG